MKIELTETEERICQLLNGCAMSLQKEKNVYTTCRIAGGWVRDKLLGSQSNDIDVALSNAMGVEFAEHLAIYARREGIEAGTISKIAQNPNQSKHLETATCKILGLDIDFVNLRSEEYASNSRIPSKVSFGTPLQDALRRDITINSLFYNVHTHVVEDFTGKGLDDLRNGIIRTPLPPAVTFLDDPLRILRCVRFASRFGFDIDPDLKAAASDPVVQTSLAGKVSRERVGEELSKMMKGRDPLLSMKLIHELSLYTPIFSINLPEKEKFSTIPKSPDTALASASILQLLTSHSHDQLPTLHPSLLVAFKNDPSCKPRLFLAAALTPFTGITYPGKKSKNLPAVEAVIREALKLGTQNHFLDGIPLLFEACRKLHSYLETSSLNSDRVVIGKLLRDKTIHHHHTGSHWTSSILFSLVQELVPLYTTSNEKLDVQEASKVVMFYNAFMDEIDKFGLSDAVDAKPLLDGNKIVTVLGASKGGPWVSQIQDYVVDWQLRNPQGTSEECNIWLRHENISGRLPVHPESSEPSSKRQRRK
ncbi:hypothetical protein BDQ12DRAFT_600250 [Crucibulum laeve]|uniref:Poly A polymerase head domain-containing protein n=1 Tax=Crucibulum laeve TaxID=68775 RepID=A0A5C3M6B3_9AGAR|nr:hypothetical protein BDQ12DRAFT_600250 [Crucibulum laeve]